MHWRLIEFVADPAWAAQGPQADTSQFVRLPPEEAERGSAWYVFSLELTQPLPPVVPIAVNPLAPPLAPVSPPPPAIWQPKWILNRAPEMLRIPVVPVVVPSGNEAQGFAAGLQWSLELLVTSRPAVPDWKRGVLMLGREAVPLSSLEQEPPVSGKRLWLGLAFS